jgi:hypothetical protein
MLVPTLDCMQADHAGEWIVCEVNAEVAERPGGGPLTRVLQLMRALQGMNGENAGGGGEFV